MSSQNVSNAKKRKQPPVSQRTRNKRGANRKARKVVQDREADKPRKTEGVEGRMDLPVSESLQSQPIEDVSFDSSVSYEDSDLRDHDREEYHHAIGDRPKSQEFHLPGDVWMRDPEAPEVFVLSRYANKYHRHFFALYELACNSPQSFSLSRPIPR